MIWRIVCWLFGHRWGKTRKERFGSKTWVARRKCGRCGKCELRALTADDAEREK